MVISWDQQVFRSWITPTSISRGLANVFLFLLLGFILFNFLDINFEVITFLASLPFFMALWHLLCVLNIIFKFKANHIKTRFADFQEFYNIVRGSHKKRFTDAKFASFLNYELIGEQKYLSFATISLALFTAILAISTYHLTILQSPTPEFILDVQDPVPIECEDGEFRHAGPLLKLANVGSRTAINTKLFVNFDESLLISDVLDPLTVTEFKALFNKYQEFSESNPTDALRCDVWWEQKPASCFFSIHELKPGDIKYFHFRVYSEDCLEPTQMSFYVSEEGHNIRTDLIETTLYWEDRG